MAKLQFPKTLKIESEPAPQGHSNEFDSLWSDEPVDESATEPTPEPTTETGLVHYDCEYYEDRLSIAENRWQAEKAFCETGLRVLSLEEELESTTTKLEEARRAVAEFERDPAAKPKTTKPQPIAAAGETLHKAETCSTSPTVYGDKSHEEILKTPTNTLDLGKIKRLGGQKLQRIYDEFPTIGDMEIARKRAHDNRDHFAKVLPQGIGRGIADAIEEVLLNVLGNFDVGAPEREDEVATEQPTEQSEQSEQPTTNNKAHSDVQANVIPFVVQRANEIDNGQPCCLNDCGAGDGRAWQGGFDASEAGWLLSDCPYVAGKIQDDWIRGFLSAELLKDGDNDL